MSRPPRSTRKAWPTGVVVGAAAWLCAALATGLVGTTGFVCAATGCPAPLRWAEAVWPHLWLFAAAPGSIVGIYFPVPLAFWLGPAPYLPLALALGAGAARLLARR